MKKTTLLKSTLCAAAIAMAFTASAAPRFGKGAGTGPSYDNFGVGYTVVDMDDMNTDFDGYSIGLEKTLSKSWYAGVSYSSTSNKDQFMMAEGGLDVYFPANGSDIDSYTLGLGYIVPMNKTTSMDIFVGFVKQRLDQSDVLVVDRVSLQQQMVAGQSFSGDGFQVGINLRQRVGNLEWALSPAYTDLDFDGQSDRSFQVSLSGEYFIAPTVSLGAAVTVGEDANALTAGVRYHF